MSAGETIASWIDQLRQPEAEEVAAGLRSALIASLKADGAGWDGVTEGRLTGLLQEWFKPVAADWDGLPELGPDEAAQAAPLVKEWLELFDDGRTTPPLIATEDYVGTLHAMRCAFRGQPLEIPQEQRATPQTFRGTFNLRG